MQALRRCHYISKAFFSSRMKPEQPIFCQQRPKIPDFLRELFVQNLDNIAMLLPKADLKFASLVAYNFSKFGIENDEIKDLITKRIQEEVESLTPELAYDLVFNLRDLVTIENSEIYGSIFAYCQKYFYLFDTRQLEIIDGVFSGLGSNFVLSMDAIFENPNATIQITEDILSFYKINVPKDELDVIIHPFHKIIEVHFKKSSKVLSLAGIAHEDWDSIRRTKNLINDNDFDFYFMEMGPLTHSDTVQGNVNIELSESAIKRRKKNKELKIDKFLDDYVKSSESANNKPREPGLDYFDRYGRIALLDGPLLEWYTEEILKNNPQFKINEAERVVSKLNVSLFLK